LIALFASPMDSLSKDQPTQSGVIHNHYPTIDASNQHPNKIQKITNQQSLHTNCSINIPAFMGPQPIIHHYAESSFLPYSPSNLQNQEDPIQEDATKSQDQLKTSQESPRRSTNTNHYNHLMTGISMVFLVLLLEVK
jgi:hypothetical protein